MAYLGNRIRVFHSFLTRHGLYATVGSMASCRIIYSNKRTLYELLFRAYHINEQPNE